MAHQRTLSTVEGTKEPHSVSLKVLRLSRPSFSYRFGLPFTESPGLPEIPREAGLGYPSADVNNDFILTPLLTLPPAFGLAYVGETFSCTFCANNELSLDDKTKSVNSVRIIGEIQTPTKTVPLELEPPEEDAKGSPLGPGESLQKVVKHELVEEGNHTLAVTVTYSETALTQGEGGISQAIGSKVRTFRKLYQFLAQPCIVIRTKAGELPPSKLEDEKGKNTSGPSLLRYILEAQLENVGEGPVLLDSVTLITRPPLRATSLNWDVPSPGRPKEAPLIHPRDITQVAFLIEQQAGVIEGLDDLLKEHREGRALVGRLGVVWRGAMGDMGTLTTNWLGSRRR